MLNKLLARVYDTSPKPADSSDSIGDAEGFVCIVNIVLSSAYLTGIGLDSAIIPLSNKNLFLVQSVDFFYPLCDDANLMGKLT